MGGRAPKCRRGARSTLKFDLLIIFIVISAISIFSILKLYNLCFFRTDNETVDVNTIERTTFV